MGTPDLIPPHGGYRHLKSFQLAQLCYDLTAQFCDRYIPPRSRTHDQMVQAARSGVQNIAEGSQASGTSKKTELKLTNVARASLEELRLDYEDFLRQRGLEQWPPAHPILQRFKARRCATVADVRHWIEAERAMARAGDSGSATRTDTDFPGQPRTGSTRNQAHATGTYPELSANAALVLIGVACALLDRQLASLAKTFTQEGGFTERLDRTRRLARELPRRPSGPSGPFRPSGP